MANVAVKKAAATSTVITDAVRNRAQTAQKQETQTKQDAFAAIQTNTFAQIIFDPKLDLAAKRDAIASALTFTGTKEEMRTRVQEYENIKEFLQQQRTTMAEEIIKLTDTNTYGEIKSIVDDMYGSLDNFDKKMEPLMEILDAIYKIRTEGSVSDTFKEIQQDRENEAKLQEKLSGLTSSIDEESDRLDELNVDITSTPEERLLWPRWNQA